MGDDFYRNRRGGGPLGAMAGLLLLSLMACSDNTPAPPVAPTAGVTVQVVAADAKAGTITVRGSGLSAPDAQGTQVLNVGAGDAAIGYVGHTIHGDLGKSSGAWRLDDIWPADPAGVNAVNEAAKQIHQDLVDLGRKAYRDVGDSLPAFALYNQNGEIVRPGAFRGQHLVVNFIFTHCTNATMCPANTQRMAQLQQEIKAAKLANITLVTITIDPESDTPGVLRQYADGYKLDFSNFQLLTAPPAEMNSLLEQFGILTRQQDGTLQHTMATFIVSPEGRITYRHEGESWTIEDVLGRLKAATAPATAVDAAKTISDSAKPASS